ncbi:serine hydrolase [Micromonospora sp. DT47]|uniref:serine hydrolase n=1 Tax=Micromonospora sp. DT47 TaxID=3393431 RepID=UPI003CF7A4BA
MSKQFTAAAVLLAQGGALDLDDRIERWFDYSSPGYVLLAEVAQRVADRPYRDVLATEIFAPLGMERTFAGSPGDRDDIAHGHGVDGGARPLVGTGQRGHGRRRRLVHHR